MSLFSDRLKGPEDMKPVLDLKKPSGTAVDEALHLKGWHGGWWNPVDGDQQIHLNG